MVDIRAVRGALDNSVAEAVRALAARAHDADGVAPLSEQPLLWLADPAAPVAHLLVERPGGPEAPGGALVGYAQLDLGAPGAASAELVVDPAVRRRGIGRGLLGQAHALAESAGGLRVWAHGDLPPAQALARAAGMAPVRELWQMRLDLRTADPEPGAASSPQPPQMPDGVTVRTFVPGKDEDAWVALNARAFADHPEQGRLTRADLLAREAEPWFDPEGFWLAERDGRLLGSMWTKVAEPGVGEVYALGIDPDAQGLGLGGALTRLAVAALRERGLGAVELYTEGDNEPAIRTYARAGFTRSAVDVMYGTPALSARPVTR
ncbi:mycothiol synthase [Cellulomonas cellasea]|uniref:mycothiol synthase n=1 Tax=Cellulomonas cellasea TaxID=43670 RepID=UPI0025A40209|nr:mycothiol synthase [Cellulomonas cellasea]MDM8086212.1 mycothiol synthase [Cellulomonas cellasea]